MDNTASIDYKTLVSIKDDTFEVDQISQYLLSLQVNENNFRIAINNPAKNRCLFLEDFEFSSIRYVDQLIEQLEDIYENHHLLQAGFWNKVIISVNNSNFTLVPKSLFDPAEARNYLQLNCDLDEEDEVLYYEQNSNDAVNIFPINKKLAKWFEEKYQNTEIQFVHQTSCFLEGIVKSVDSEDKLALYANIEENFATLSILKNNNLEFCNIFEYKTPNDLLYYIMFVFDEFKLSQEETPLYLWGMIDQEDIRFKKLYEFIRHIYFGERPSSFYFGYLFDEVADHKYFNVLSTPLCE